MDQDRVTCLDAGRSTRPSHTVMKTSGTAAASRMLKTCGFRAMSRASTAANSASEPWMPPTSSPDTKPVTPSPDFFDPAGQVEAEDGRHDRLRVGALAH